MSLTTGRKWKNKADESPRVQSGGCVSGSNANTCGAVPPFGERDSLVVVWLVVPR